MPVSQCRWEDDRGRREGPEGLCGPGPPDILGHSWGSSRHIRWWPEWPEEALRPSCVLPYPSFIRGQDDGPQHLRHWASSSDMSVAVCAVHCLKRVQIGAWPLRLLMCMIPLSEMPVSKLFLPLPVDSVSQEAFSWPPVCPSFQSAPYHCTSHTAR